MVMLLLHSYSTFSSLKRDAGTMKCLFCFFVQMLQLQKKKTFLEAADKL